MTRQTKKWLRNEKNAIMFLYTHKSSSNDLFTRKALATHVQP